MYNLILVEDESYMLNQLESALDWEKLGFKIAGLFTDGQDASKYIENNPVNAIITDISMPYMSGIDLLKFCHTNFPDIKIALLSAYKSFDYAKEAILMNVVNYIIKPVTYNDLLNTAIILKERLDANAEDDFSAEISDAKMKLQEIISDLLCGIIETKQELQSQFDKNGILLNVEKTNVFSFTVHINNLENNWKYGINRFEAALDYMISLKIGAYYTVVLGFDKTEIELISFSDSQKTSDALIWELTERFKNYLKLDFTINDIQTFNLNKKPYPDIINKNIYNLKSTQMINSIISGAEEYARKNYANPIKLIDVANYVHLNEIYFCSYYKKHTKKSFIAFLTEVRMKKAKELLESKDTKISTMHLEIGYKNNSHFYNTFKKHFNGLTPLEYQNLILNKKEKENEQAD